MILLFCILLTSARCSEHFVIKFKNYRNIKDVQTLLSSYGLELVHGLETIGPYLIVKRTEIAKEFKKRSIINIVEKAKKDPKISWIKKQIWYDREPRKIEDNQKSNIQFLNIYDPLFYQQWYLSDSHHLLNSNQLDINIVSAWAKGYDGTGVVVSVLDDGISYRNTDIAENYDESASYDFIDYDKDPSPENIHTASSHGTKCAGTIAASKNSFCGVGVAFNVSIGGIRMLNLKTTDSIEASALSYQNNYIDIYSCNWGPKDDGSRFGKPGPLTLRALRLGATKGRRSLGSIYVWSSGNGAANGDDCNADGYVTNIYTIAIGAITSTGEKTSFSESCASMLAVTLSGCSGNGTNRCKIITTDVDDKCVDNFAGTSSAASLATGIIALMLQSNPLLTWRDIQHLIVENSIITHPTETGWQRNGAGKWFNPLYGYGRLDASVLVDRAYHWELVGNQLKCRCQSRNGLWSLSQGSSLILTEKAESCYENNEYSGNINIQKLEHVQLVVTISHLCRGRLKIQIFSPLGTKSTILKPRQKDTSSHGIHEWVFTSVHFWGEDPKGYWTIIITDLKDPDPCISQIENSTENFFELKKGGHKLKNKTLNQKLDDKDIPKDEAEMVEEIYENTNPTDKSEITEKIKLTESKDKHLNESMIERIVVEKYRMLDHGKANDPKHFNEFGDIKVIINDQPKKHKKNSNREESQRDMVNIPNEESPDEELWRKELEEMQNKNIIDSEEESQTKYEYKRELDNSSNRNRVRESISGEMQEVTGMVKLITLVFYGT